MKSGIILSSEWNRMITFWENEGEKERKSNWTKVEMKEMQEGKKTRSFVALCR